MDTEYDQLKRAAEYFDVMRKRSEVLELRKYTDDTALMVLRLPGIWRSAKVQDELNALLAVGAVVLKADGTREDNAKVYFRVPYTSLAEMVQFLDAMHVLREIAKTI